MSKQEPVAVSGIHLIKLGENVIVNVEIDGQWFEVIREHESGSFSHIVEPGGIRAARERGKHFALTD